MGLEKYFRELVGAGLAGSQAQFSTVWLGRSYRYYSSLLAHGRDRLWDFWVAHVGTEPKDTDPVFATREGKRLGSTKKALAELLKACDLLVDYRGVRRTSYSFRHFYISQ